ncbi:unnamed protein product [Camellia sinensis]
MKLIKGTTPESWLDTKFESCGTPEVPLTSMLIGPKFMASKLYQLCPIQVFVVCNEDYTILEEYQWWTIEKSKGVKEAKEIKGADHMAMFSKPRELCCCCLLEIANKHT